MSLIFKLPTYQETQPNPDYVSVSNTCFFDDRKFNIVIENLNDNKLCPQGAWTKSIPDIIDKLMSWDNVIFKFEVVHLQVEGETIYKFTRTELTQMFNDWKEYQDGKV